MNTKVVFAIAVCAALIVCSCGSSPQSLIVGKWEMSGAKVNGADVPNAPVGAVKMTAEFGSDGTAKITMFGQTLQGTYKLNAANELEWTVNGETTKSKVTVTSTELDV